MRSETRKRRPSNNPELDLRCHWSACSQWERVKQLLIAEQSPLVKTLTVQERPGKTAFRFWQEGAGDDRNLKSERALLNSIAYLHDNPVRAGLVTQAREW